MTARALRKIQAELEQIAASATDEHPVDPHALRVIARKVEAQAEIVEGGLAGE